MAALLAVLSGCHSFDVAYLGASAGDLRQEWANGRIVCAEMIARGRTPVWPCPP
jgi:hypothetical protein